MRMQRFIACLLFLALGATLAGAATDDLSAPARPGYYRRLFGISANGVPGRFPPAFEFAGAMRAPAFIHWRIVPGQWPVDFTVEQLDSDADGEELDLESLGRLFAAAHEADANVIPVLSQADLAQLGYSSLEQSEPSPRWKFLAAISNRLAQAARERGERGVLPIHMRIDIFATPEGPRSIDAQQLVLDALALKAGGANAGIMADIGDYPRQATAEMDQQILNFSRGALRSTLLGVVARVILDEPDFAQGIQTLQRLRAAAYLLPVSLSGIQPGTAFRQAAAALDADDWSTEQTEAAYASALAAYATATFGSGAVFWDDAPATPTAASTPAAIAAGRLAQWLKPFPSAMVTAPDDEAGVWLIHFQRRIGPPSYIVFRDWAGAMRRDPQAPGVIHYTAHIPMQTYRISPLVDEPGLWEEPRVIAGTKTGLELPLGRSPLFIEIDNPGRSRAVPLGMPSQYRAAAETDASTTGTATHDSQP